MIVLAEKLQTLSNAKTAYSDIEAKRTAKLGEVVAKRQEIDGLMALRKVFSAIDTHQANRNRMFEIDPQDSSVAFNEGIVQTLTLRLASQGVYLDATVPISHRISLFSFFFFFFFLILISH
jgi:hypothetical protein